MNPSFQDTIVAIASAPGPGARGIIRISGTQTDRILQEIFQPSPEQNLPGTLARRITGSLRLQGPDDSATVSADAFFWPTARSFTGEPIAELHLIGSPPLLNLLVRQVCAAGARHAQPGEFTMRAFLNARIDLMQAEAVLGVIDAHSPIQLTTALSQLAGGISGQMQTLREQLLLHLADLEAGLDFVEEDIDFVSRTDLVLRLQEAVQVLSRLKSQSSQRLLASGKRTIVLAGLPNAGKSTLLNALVGSEAAIVSPLAGTTRDFVRASVRLHELTIEILDTAGWEQKTAGIEALVELQRHRQIQQADLILWCSAADLTADQQELDDRLLRGQLDQRIPVLHVITKADLSPGETLNGQPRLLTLSAHSSAGIDELKQHLYSLLTDSTEARTELITSTAVRCQQSLSQALASASLALELAENQAGDELISLELREVLNHLGQILGVVYTDDILDRIFSRFCIGK